MSRKTGTEKTAMNRRSLLRMIGTLTGSTAMYNAMTELGMAKPSTFTGPPKLAPVKPGASVLVLGAGIAGMNAAWFKELGTAGQPNKPARATVQVSGLADGAALVEIEMIAVKKAP